MCIRDRDEIAVAVNGFGNSLFPEIPQQFHPTIGLSLIHIYKTKEEKNAELAK